MKLTLLGLCFLSFAAAAQDSSILRNDREGVSFYSSNSFNGQLWDALREVDGKVIISTFKKAADSTSCAFEINKTLQTEFSKLRPKFKDLTGALYYLRSQEEIDDVAASLLLNAQKVAETPVSATEEKNILSPKPAVVEKNISIIQKFDQRGCLDDSYRKLITDLKGISDSEFEASLYLGMKKKNISIELYTTLEQARINKLNQMNLTLKSYLQKKKNLRTQYPLKDLKERSKFVSTKAKGIKASYRQRLMENYNDAQIVLMANVVKKLRKRLEASKVEILVYSKDENLDETIPLEPMERFRFAIKLLRKEMTLLSLNSYFGGRTPDYLDLMTASYEIGMIPASELEQIASLQEIWNPTKSFWDKAQVWVSTFSSVATIVIPPPYGFIPALVLVAIEATSKKDDSNDDNSSLF